MTLEQIRCADIVADPHRGGDQPQEIEALAESVRQHGVLRPVLLRASSDGYVIVHGERRWRAAQMVGLDAIPACLGQDFAREEAIAALLNPEQWLRSE